MLRILTLAIVLISVLGCRRNDSEEASTKPQTVAEKYNVPPIESLAIPTEIKPSLSDAEHPKSVNDFVVKFHELHRKDFFAPFVELCYWNNMDDAAKTKYLTALRQIFWAYTKGRTATIRSVKKIQVTPVNFSGPELPDGYMNAFPLKIYEEDRLSKLSPKPTHELEVEAHMDDSTSMTNYFLIGQQNGKYYFCTAE